MKKQKPPFQKHIEIIEEEMATDDNINKCDRPSVLWRLQTKTDSDTGKKIAKYCFDMHIMKSSTLSR